MAHLNLAASLACAAAVSTWMPGAAAAQSPARPIQDNSFLVEEAYNQERGVVQHISTFQRRPGEWAYSLTQEWPLGGIRHQLSYTLPILHADGSTGLGDVGLNYRLQLAGSGTAPIAVAPRFTLLLPSGSSGAGRGAGGVGVQLALPLSVVLAPALVAHVNAGITMTPHAAGPGSARGRTTSIGGGASVVWLVASRLNFLLEGVWARSQSIAGGGLTSSEDSYYLSPGVRGAIDFASGLQIVPGLAYAIGLGPSGGTGSLLVYLSFEHPFAH